MLFYLYTVVTLIPSTFLLFGASFDIKLNLTIGLVYSFLLFIAFIARWRQYNFSILYYAVMYWFLLSFVMNSISNNDVESLSKFESFLFNLIPAIILLALIAFFYKRVEELSPFQLLLAGQTLLVLWMYLGNWSLNYFIFIYFVSTLLIIFSTFVFYKQKPKVDYITITLVYVLTYLLFICIEWHDSSNIWFQNYNIFGFLTALVSIVSALCSVFEFETLSLTATTSLDSAPSNAINQNYNTMWKQQSSNGFPSRARWTSTSLLGWPSFPPLSISKLHPIPENLLPISSPKSVSAFIIPSSDSSKTSLFALGEVDKQILSTIKEEHKISTSGKDLSINTSIEAPSQYNSSPNAPVSTTHFGNIKPGHASNFIRSYSTAVAPVNEPLPEIPALEYELKAEFDIIPYDYDVHSKLEELKCEDLKYTFFNQVNISVLQGFIGMHHMALIFVSDEQIFLVVLTTSKRIPLSDSTFNEQSKNKLPAKPIIKEDEEIPAVQTLFVSPKLLWAKGISKDKYQYMASTVFAVSEEIVDDLIKAGLKKDPDGQAKLVELYPELKPVIIEAFEKSSFQGKDGLNYLSVANLSKK